jgi:hypothetical protein
MTQTDPITTTANKRSPARDSHSRLALGRLLEPSTSPIPGGWFAALPRAAQSITRLPNQAAYKPDDTFVGI